MEKEEFEALTTDDLFRKAVMKGFADIRDQFIAVNTRLSSQDAAIAQNTALTQTVNEETKAVREFMSDGATAAKFFCRLAKGWRFLLKWVFVPFCVPFGMIYAVGYYRAHGSFPTWIIAVAKALGW
ncbi:hypothetical protein [Paraburkholderia sp.]|uniref:hypothetical protein n=1 Tax=Paraburkholderia sp. TaxID=1926495 RepID=UPI003C7E1A0A